MDTKLIKKIQEIEEIVQLDFEHDNELFIDPYRINDTESNVLARAKAKIIKYFNAFFDAVDREDRSKVTEMAEHLHEINATKLGYTNKEDIPKGKGFSKNDLLTIFDEAVKIKGYITDMPDILILAEKVGPDKVSDLTTNIMYKELLEFTKYIIEKYDLEVEYVEKRKWVLDELTHKWKKEKIEIPIIEGKEIIFLPQNIVAKYEIFSYQNVYNKLIYPFYKNNPAIHRLIRLLKNKEEVSDCKKLKKKYPQRRSTVKQFINEYPEKYSEFKKEMKRDYWRQ